MTGKDVEVPKLMLEMILDQPQHATFNKVIFQKVT